MLLYAAKHISDAISREEHRIGLGQVTKMVEGGVKGRKERTRTTSEFSFHTHPRSSDFYLSNMVTEIQITACKQVMQAGYKDNFSSS